MLGINELSRRTKGFSRTSSDRTSHSPPRDGTVHRDGGGPYPRNRPDLPKGFSTTSLPTRRWALYMIGSIDEAVTGKRNESQDLPAEIFPGRGTKIVAEAENGFFCLFRSTSILPPHCRAYFPCTTRNEEIHLAIDEGPSSRGVLRCISTRMRSGPNGDAQRGGNQTVRRDR